MTRTRILAATLALLCLLTVNQAYAAETDADAVYCYSAADFSDAPDLKGICITGLPDKTCGTVLLDSRVICAGDILTVQQVEQLTFCPLQTDTDREATLTYLPIYENRVEAAETMTLAIRGKK
ncbi:MAG: hypothetical protein J6Q54_06830, partial [Oscillospiraceae bacterium]|nr:hypothetical protein [Oscillospiraceae bacterium]